MTTTPIDLANFDTSVSPADDFYRYANGGWLDANPVPPEYSRWGAFSEVNERNEEILHRLLEEAAATGGDQGSPERMVGDYYASAMDEEQIAATGIAPLQPWLDRIATAETLDDLRELAADLHPNGFRFMFGVGVSSDFDDPTVHLLYIGQGGLGLPERDYYLRDDERSVALREQYRTHVAAQLRNLGDGEAAAAADAILAFETALAQPSYTAAQLRDVDLIVNRRHIDQLDELMPGFALPRYLAAVGAGSVTEVNVDNPGFFAAAATLLADTPIETLRSYARWHLVRSVASSLTSEFADENFRFYGQVLGGQKEQKPRWKRVLAMASADIGELVAQLFVAEAFPPEAKQRAEELVDHLLIVMRESLVRRDWMTDATRHEALAKLAGFRYKIGYPDEWRDYTDLVIDRGPLVVNRLRAAAFEYQRNVRKLGEPVDLNEWEMPPHAVNAYYHPLKNEIVFPAGILQPPFFYADADDAVNYGGIGGVIGHEITHGFDDMGRRFDAKGQLRDWWSEEDREEFTRRADVVVAQYEGYGVADDLNVNGRLTLGENIADLGGMTIAYRALQRALAEHPVGDIDGLSPDQRFFLSWATIWRSNYTEEWMRLLVQTDPHSPSQFRCNGPLSNFTPFAEAFELDGDAPMMRAEDDRVEIW
jgi:predicted metalloendopeptidase